MLPLRKLMLSIILVVPLLAAAQGLIWQKSVHGFDYYRGQLSVHGQYLRRFDDEILGNDICFVVDQPQAQLLPRNDGNMRLEWFCFSNQDTAQQLFNLSNTPPRQACGYQGTATVTIAQYIAYIEESEGHDMARLLSAQNIGQPQLLHCDNNP